MAASELATAQPQSSWAWMPRLSPGSDLRDLGDDGARPRRAACRHWCRRARPSARRPRRPPARRRAHSRDWPCSRRRNARSRASPRARPPSPPRRFRGCRRGSPPARSRARRGPDSPKLLATKTMASAFACEQGGDAGIVGGRAAGPLGHAEGGEFRLRRRLFREEGGVERVRAGIAALDIVDAEPVEHARRRRACRRARNRRPSSARRRAASCRRDGCGLRVMARASV